MSTPTPPPTAEAIRDALGLVRLLYAARQARQAAKPPEADPLVAIGRELGDALTLTRYEEGSLGHRAALERAGKALARLADELGMDDALGDVARGARGRIVGRAPRG